MSIPQKITTSRMITGQVPPHNLDAERAVLGTMILDQARIPLVMETLKKESFYNTAHQILFETMVELYDRFGVLDLTTLCDELAKNKTLEAVGGVSYVASLEQYVITTANIEHHARIVFNKAKLRKLIEAAHSILDLAYSEQGQTEEILDLSEKLIFDISQERASRDFLPISDLTLEAIEEINIKYHDRRAVTGLPTGYYQLDEWTSGLQSSDLIIIAGRPSMGKTAFGLNIIYHIASELLRPVALFSLEMSSAQINHRLLCSMTKVDGRRVRTGNLSADELKSLSEKGKKLSTLPIFIDDTPAISILELRAKARRLKSIHKELALIVVDYLQLMRGSGRAETRQQEVAEISGSLKALSRELEIPIIAVSQLSRMIEHRRGRSKRPILSDLRESGAIEQDADVVLFVHREIEPGAMDEDIDPELKTKAEIIIGKQRNGPLGVVPLRFFSEFTFFANPAFDRRAGE